MFEMVKYEPNTDFDDDTPTKEVCGPFTPLELLEVRMTAIIEVVEDVDG